MTNGSSSVGLGLIPDFIDSLTDPDYEDEIRINEIAIDIFNTYLWVVCAVGIPANVVTIITVLTMRKLSPATFFVAFLALCDGLALAAKLVGHLLVKYQVEQGTVLCKLEFFPQYFSTLANWILALICAERFVSVCYPLKKAYLVTKRRSYISAGALATVLLLVFAIIFAVMRMDSPSHLCGTLNLYVDFWRRYWYWINATLYLFLPFLFISTLTSAIIRGLCMSRRHRRSLVHKSSGGNRRPSASDKRLLQETERAERALTIMLIAVSVLFLVLSLPACIHFLTTMGTKSYSARWNLFIQISYVFADSSHAVNFFLYFFTAQKFRAHAFSLFYAMVGCSRGFGAQQQHQRQRQQQLQHQQQQKQSQQQQEEEKQEQQRLQTQVSYADGLTSS